MFQEVERVVLAGSRRRIEYLRENNRECLLVIILLFEDPRGRSSSLGDTRSLYYILLFAFTSTPNKTSTSSFQANPIEYNIYNIIVFLGESSL